jgi:hypothetical protein
MAYVSEEPALSIFTPYVEAAVSSVTLVTTRLTHHKTVIFLRLLLFQDHLCGLVVRIPGYGTEIYCASCEVRTGFIYVM